MARTVAVDRKTVRRYVEEACDAGFERGQDVDDTVLAAVSAAIRPGARSEVGCMRKLLREHAEQLRDWAQQGCQGPKLVKLLKRSTGVAVPLRTMQRFVADDLDLGRQTETVRVVDPPAGRVIPGVGIRLRELDAGTFRNLSELFFVRLR